MTETPPLLITGPDDAALTLALAHGAGAPMDSPFLKTFADGLSERGWRVVRFEFPYMAERRATGRKKPPDRMPVLMDSWAAVIEALGRDKLVIGGKSMGGRVASMIAQSAGVRGLVCLGYPFHAVGRAENARTDHLMELTTPALFVQGERDNFGSRAEVEGYGLSPAIRFHWAEDGDHDLKPRVVSGRTLKQNWADGIEAVDTFLAARARG